MFNSTQYVKLSLFPLCIDHDIKQRFPIGTRLRILPNHACATGAQHPQYGALRPDGGIELWPRFYGW
ncbi:D-threo-3-hydroxyaspartate dehydratase [Kushneria phyllosphaerae]|uniref:D-threo-3-hydroxyaspartate dehydratase n=1 Tax=Kushneria phyllosphaerae TaxID=2100822 RepID=A0A2R8CH62_9GAMM|nr:D-threo-3-hydroxyaspartate dehydratase [Kushneria phyllosphaerae]